MPGADYTDVTEACGDQITGQALDMMQTRYAFAKRFCEGRDVLEVACGAGQGLGLLGGRARRVVGGDYTDRLLEMARAHYAGRVPLIRLDAQKLPFADATFDVIVLYEALYYLSDPAAFVRETRRVLRTGGHVIICTVNRQWADFNPSPFSTGYLSADELHRLLRAEGFAVDVYGAFAVERKRVRDRVVSACKRAAVRMHVIPKTMRGKRLLKRAFLGRLVDFPAEIREGMGVVHDLVALNPSRVVEDYKVLYAVGARP